MTNDINTQNPIDERQACERLATAPYLRLTATWLLQLSKRENRQPAKRGTDLLRELHNCLIVQDLPVLDDPVVALVAVRVQGHVRAHDTVREPLLDHAHGPRDDSVWIVALIGIVALQTVCDLPGIRIPPDNAVCMNAISMYPASLTAQMPGERRSKTSINLGGDDSKHRIPPRLR